MIPDCWLRVVFMAAHAGKHKRINYSFVLFMVLFSLLNHKTHLLVSEPSKKLAVNSFTPLRRSKMENISLCRPEESLPAFYRSVSILRMNFLDVPTGRYFLEEKTCSFQRCVVPPQPGQTHQHSHALNIFLMFFFF